MSFQNESTEKNHNHFNLRSHLGGRKKCTSRKKNHYSECYKKVLYAVPKPAPETFDKPKPEFGPTRNAQP